MKNFNIVLFLVLVSSAVFFACKTEASSPDLKTFTVTIDQGGGTGLTQLTYPVQEGDSLKAGDLKGASTIQYMYISSYTADDGSNFVIDSTPVNRDLTIKAHWDFVSTLDADCATISNAKTSLLTFAQNGNTLGIACAVKAKAGLEEVTPYGSTAILEAARTSPLDNLKILYVSGANVKAKDAGGLTALMYATKYQKIDSVKYLVETVKVNANDAATIGMTALMYAAQNGFINIVEYLVGTVNVTVTAKNNELMTAFMIAVQNGNLDIAKYLFEHGGNITDRIGDGKNALLLAASISSPSPSGATANDASYNLVSYLLETAKANIADVDSDGMTALMLAVSAGLPKTVEYLANHQGIALDATATAGTYKDKTALGIANTLATNNPSNLVYKDIVSSLSKVGAK